MTGRVALIGSPLRRRHSEVMHNAAFAHYGIDAVYELRDLPATDLASFFAEVREPGWLGFQVTAPHKQAVTAHLDEVAPAAAAIGAVNSGQRRDDGALVGFNTDATGFLSALRSDLGFDPAGATAVVAGAGGAARAVVWALLDSGAGRVVVANRSPARADALARDLASFGEVTAVAAGDAFAAELAAADLAVNATTVGMTSDGVAFDVAALPARACVFDLVYVPPETPLVLAARARGLRVANGLEMLVRQAEVAFERWTGVAGASGVMRAALDAWDGGAEER